MRHFVLLVVVFVFTSAFMSSVMAEPFEEDSYKVRVNDIISIEILNYAELGTNAVVASDGTISFPYLGVIKVKDLTLQEIKKLITEGLGESYIKYPVVSVSLTQFLKRQIYTYGEIRRNGDIPFNEGMTVIKALSLSGGIGEKGLHGKIKVRREMKKGSGYKDIEIDLEGTSKGIETGDMLLEPDDVLIAERDKTFYVNGEVLKPGEYALRKDMTVERALSEAGGISDGGLYGRIKVRRKHEGGTGYDDIEIDLDGQKEGTEKGDMLLKSDDILIVERNKTFLIQGEVNKSGKHDLEDNMTVLRAIIIAGGIREDGMYGRVKVRRKHEGGTGYDDIEIDLDGQKEGTETGDMLLKPDDILIVERNEAYLIYGEINSPGEYVLKDNSTVFKAITFAGGFTKWGSLDRIRLLRPTNSGDEFEVKKVKLNDFIKGNHSADVAIQPGDIIIVSSGIL